ncbi:hypothetical protein OKW45_007303 [Paraburkholderia sp. WSM4175]|uniref:hypothetical protein n=1 Tax=Paraburkholderia sp. WSM4175 TaxID=2991072 RepID=UPI003D1EFB98
MRDWDGITVAFHLDNEFNASLKYRYYGRLLSQWFQAPSTTVKPRAAGLAAWRHRPRPDSPSSSASLAEQQPQRDISVYLRAFPKTIIRGPPHAPATAVS